MNGKQVRPYVYKPPSGIPAKGSWPQFEPKHGALSDAKVREGLSETVREVYDLLLDLADEPHYLRKADAVAVERLA